MHIEQHLTQYQHPQSTTQHKLQHYTPIHLTDQDLKRNTGGDIQSRADHMAALDSGLP